MKITIVFILIGFSLVGFASDDPVWYRGSIVSNDKEVKVGLIAIHPAFDLIIFKDPSGVKTYSAHQLTSLFFYDEKVM